MSHQNGMVRHLDKTDMEKIKCLAGCGSLVLGLGQVWFESARAGPGQVETEPSGTTLSRPGYSKKFLYTFGFVVRIAKTAKHHYFEADSQTPPQTWTSPDWHPVPRLRRTFAVCNGCSYQHSSCIESSRVLLLNSSVSLANHSKAKQDAYRTGRGTLATLLMNTDDSK